MTLKSGAVHGHSPPSTLVDVDDSALLDAALLFALLAVVPGAAFARRAWREPPMEDPDDAS